MFQPHSQVRRGKVLETIQDELDLSASASEMELPAHEKRAIESEHFPIEFISDIAERESWRKEVNRPPYHVHKWWAQRLGTVFRAALIGAAAPEEADVKELFHSPVRLRDATVFDPFMGSGTTLGEALKLGSKAIGRDINPVAHFAVKNALQLHPRAAVQKAFDDLEVKVSSQIQHFYTTTTPEGDQATVLYFFWVKSLSCPNCSNDVDLFSNYVFSRHAYPKKHPESRCVCPSCGEVNHVAYNASSVTCSACKSEFDPQAGPARGTKATCPSCHTTFGIAGRSRDVGGPPSARMYAKLVLQADGTKRYLPVSEEDLELYSEAERQLEACQHLFPQVALSPGYNTNQAMNYGYSHWHQMFNSRQLLCLGLLGKAISEITEPAIRDAMLCLFSGTLEFNNMFASFKGEGTGAVRHMFYHHILKPERTPLEANPWGTQKSSGAFSTLFRSRLLRAIQYCEDPFELRLSGGKSDKVFGLSDAIGHEVAESFSDFGGAKRLYLSCGDSSKTDLEDGCVDIVATDPPFFDNVNYSQLADFFHVWQRHLLGDNGSETTRSAREVQHQDVEAFSGRLGDVFRECHRVLKDDGIMLFSYHHSRTEGWSSVLGALRTAGFVITASQPVKAEMSGATPKNQAKEPIDLDIIVVCRKRGADQPSFTPCAQDAEKAASAQVSRLALSGRKLSRNDIMIILMGQLIKQESMGSLAEEPSKLFGADLIDTAIAKLVSLRDELQSRTCPAQ